MATSHTVESPVPEHLNSNHINNDVPYIRSDSEESILQETKPKEQTIRLPRISTRRPNNFQAISLHANGNIPLVNGERQQPLQSNIAMNSIYGYPLPTHTNAVAIRPQEFKYINRCRSYSLFMLWFYTFAIVLTQPFFVCTLGILAALLGYNGARFPPDYRHYVWTKWYVWMNYVMVFVNVGLSAMYMIYLYNSTSYTTQTPITSSVNVPQFGIYTVILTILSVVIHFPALRLGQLYLVELEQSPLIQQLYGVASQVSAIPGPIV